MPSSKSTNVPGSIWARPPVTVQILTVLLGVMAFVSIGGSFLFAFPLGDLLGYSVGTLLIAAGIGYAIIVWRLRRGERRVWLAALVLTIIHALGLTTEFLVRYGTIPSTDYPFLGIQLIIVALLLLPRTRRFFVKWSE